ncbi:unnamed protein product [Linum trigynum]|uniref:RNase H type-1 domain-containing protein n=1 Tax=Linum trigynum TaxID=586398 RepID=A0AAV2DJP8_9ROSI
MRQFHQQCEEWERLLVDCATPSLTPILHPTGLAEAPTIVCMWDGATRAGSHLADGMVLFGPHREILLDQGTQFRSIDDPLVVESLALREAIFWCVAHGFLDVKFEGDAKVIIDKINRADTRDSRLGLFWKKLCSVSILTLGLVYDL